MFFSSVFLDKMCLYSKLLILFRVNCFHALFSLFSFDVLFNFMTYILHYLSCLLVRIIGLLSKIVMLEFYFPVLLHVPVYWDPFFQCVVYLLQFAMS